MSKASIQKMDPNNLQKYINELSDNLGVDTVESFDNIGKMRLHALQLEEEWQDKQAADKKGDKETETADDGDKSKYDTSNRRGPNLGTGKYAKQRIMEGADNKTILAEIREKFPEAKTTNASINYYRNALKKEGADRTPEALRAQADAAEKQAKELRTEADALEKKLAEEAKQKAAEEAAEAKKGKAAA